MIITLTGANSFLLKAELQKLVAEFVAKYSDMGLERFDGEEIKPQQVPSIMQSLPFLTDRRMVVLQRPSAQKLVAEQVEKLLGEVADSTDLIIVEPSLDKRTSYYKALQKQTDFRPFDDLREYELQAWLSDYAKERGATLSKSDANFLVQRVGPNQLMLASEVEKLAQYDPAITKQTIELLTDPLPQSSVFDLLDAALAGKTKEVIRLYEDQRSQKVEPLAIMAMLAWQLHILALVKSAGERSPQAIASEARVSPYVLKKTMSIAGSITLEEVKHWIERAYMLDVRLKRESIDADDALLEYLLSLRQK